MHKIQIVKDSIQNINSFNDKIVIEVLINKYLIG